MSRKETRRPGLIDAAVQGRLKNAEVAQALRLTVRQVQRLRQRFGRDGAAGLVHRGRGQPSRRRMADEVRDRIVNLMTTTYAGFNDVHLTEKLCEVEHVVVSRATVRRLRRALGQPAVHRRRAPKHRSRRPRVAGAGRLVQLDASIFPWFGPGGPQATLHGTIDDATSQVLALYFRPTEDLHGYTVLLQQMCAQHGVPITLYGDRLNVFVRNDRHWSLDEELRGQQDPTHFGRMLEALGIGFIAAQSPQAKGRVERLWLTLQDRLVSELRLRGITTLDGGNAFATEFLADFTRRFACADDTAPVWRRPPPDLDALLGCRYRRIVARDNTVHLGARWIQIPPGPGRRSYAGCGVDVRELIDGRLLVFYQDVRIASQSSPGAGFVLKPRSHPSVDRARRRAVPRPVAPASTAQAPRSRPPAGPPATSHPWRTTFSSRQRRQNAASRG